MLKGKKILLGITGSIAAYKAAQLIRLFVKEGAEVKVIMTPLAKEFITPLTLATLSRNPVLCDFFETKTGDWHSHVDLGIWADVFVIAPATANTLAKMATGMADNLLLTTYLSARCPVFAAPAMDLDMYRHPATQENIELLKKRGVHFIEPATGELASGLEGKGRMEEPEKIFLAISAFLYDPLDEERKKKLNGKTVLITAGPTYELIDPVRFIGNFSSGKMGYALAEAFANTGARVILISGPVSLSTDHPNIEIFHVTTAREMLEKCLEVFPQCNIAILAAAVADYTPVNPAKTKLKREHDTLTLELKANPDIAAELGNRKKTGQILAGFALETGNGPENALQKLRKKNFDFIVLNSLEDEGAGFGTDTNKITILDNNHPPEEFSLKDKKAVALDILNKTLSFL